MDPVRLTFTASDGLTLVADAYGDPQAAPVILAHGGGQTRHAWGGTAAALARAGWYAVAYDQRGHGESDWSAELHYDIACFADDLTTIARSFSTKPAVVGASLGGVCAMLAEGEEPREVFSAIVLVDITPRVEDAGADRIMHFMTDKVDEGFATLEEVADAVAAYQPHRTRPSNLSGLEKNVRLGEDGRYRWHWDPAWIRWAQEARVSRDPERLPAAARTIGCPVLLVRGRMSDLVSMDKVEDFLATVPHARFVDVAGAAHMVAGDRNDVFTEAVAGFLGELRSA
ncbi:MAG: alpha/beta fold hydrolase [Acidimicrobiales bacterium]